MSTSVYYYYHLRHHFVMNKSISADAPHSTYVGNVVLRPAVYQITITVQSRVGNVPEFQQPRHSISDLKINGEEMIQE